MQNNLDTLSNVSPPKKEQNRNLLMLINNGFDPDLDMFIVDPLKANFSPNDFGRSPLSMTYR